MTLKHLIIFILIALPFICVAQERDNTYRLFKDGKEYQKPVVYLLEDSFEKIYKNGQEIFFLTNREKMVHNSNVHSSIKIPGEKFVTIDFYQPKELYSLEEKEFREKAEMILKETGVKPIPPIKHSILKVYIVRKLNSEYCAYEVDWM